MIAKRMIVIFPVILVLLAGWALFVSPASDIPPIDFEGYYRDAEIAYNPYRDQELSDLLSLSIFADLDNVTISHAAEKHGEDMPLYEKCNSGNNAIMGFVNPFSTHCVEVLEAEVEEGGRTMKQWLVRVVKQANGKWCEITAFSDEWASVAEVEDYLIRQGYMYMWP